MIHAGVKKTHGIALLYHFKLKCHRRPQTLKENHPLLLTVPVKLPVNE
jgi:hypothetical protein